jgi:signal transduction histidine kinase
MTSFALVSNCQSATAVPPAHWAHDVRNVLASVGLHLDTLARLSGPHGAKAANAGHALISKVSALCNVALVAAPDACSQRQPFEITTMVRHVVDLLAPAAPDGFTVNIVSDAPVHVLADQNEIFRVLFNLLHNALTVARAAPRLRRIDISVERAGRIVVLRIADNGGGLTRKVADRLFRRPAAGALHGYGLAIARELMERNGGTLSCETSAKGTTFRLELAGLFLNRAADGPVTHLLGRRAMIR